MVAWRSVAMLAAAAVVEAAWLALLLWMAWRGAAGE